MKIINRSENTSVMPGKLISCQYILCMHVSIYEVLFLFVLTHMQLKQPRCGKLALHVFNFFNDEPAIYNFQSGDLWYLECWIRDT